MILKTIKKFKARYNYNWRSEKFRYLTSIFRPFPNIIIIGAQKSGTTSLFRYLEQHPKISSSNRKEVHYFDDNFDKNSFWYKSHFPIQPESTILEASPYYLRHPHSPERIKKLLPDVKLIAILRDPTERAISHYFHQVRAGTENLSIEEALSAEDERTKDIWERIVADQSYNNRIHRRFSYKHRGLYLEQLENYWNFFDESDLLVLKSGDLFHNPINVLNQVYEFLEVVPNPYKINLKAHTVGVNREKVNESTRKYLNNYFEPHNRKLFERLGKNFDW